MAFLRVVSHTPTINATGVYLNEAIKITFDRAIRPETIDYTSFSVNHHHTFVSVPGGYSVETDASGNAVTAVFIPSVNMTPNTKYDAYIYSTPDSILALDDNGPIDATYPYTFTTGIESWATPGVSGLPASGYGAEPAPVFSGTYDPDESITNLAVIATTPKHQEPNVINAISGVAPSGILIEFNTYITSTLAQISGYLTITEEDVL